MKTPLLIILLFTGIVISKAQFFIQWDTVGHGMAGKTPWVKALAENDTNQGIIYAGGDFISTEGMTSYHVAQWTSTYESSPYGSWSLLGKGVNGEVTALAMFNHKLIAGGAFDSASGIHANNIASWDSTGWDSLAGGLNGQVYALFPFNGALYAGGSFTIANGLIVNRVAKWNGTAWSAVGTGFDSNIVYALGSYHDTLYAGGSFTSSNGKQTNYIAKWNGTNWDSVGTGMNNTVYVLDSYNSLLFAGGAFTKTDGISTNYIATWNGKQWDSLGAGTNDTVRALVSAGNFFGEIIKKPEENPFASALVVGGSFTKAGNTPSPYISLYCTQAWPGNNFYLGWNEVSGLTGPVYAITSNQSNNYVGGIFDTVIDEFFSGDTLQASYIAQFTFFLGGSINELSDKYSVSVSQNPSNGIFNFMLKDTHEDCQLEVFNIMGQEVYEENISKEQNTCILNIINEPVGMYLYRIIDNENTLIGTGKLLIQK